MRTKSAATRTDMVAVFVGALLALAAAFWFDAFESFRRWAEPHEAFELAESVVVPLVAAVALGVFSFRRWRELGRDELGREAAERGRAGEALRRSEERFRALVQNSSDIVTVLGADAVVPYQQSPSVERVPGYAPEEATGGRVFERVHPEDLGRVMASFSPGVADAAAAAGGGEPGSDDEIPHAWPSLFCRIVRRWSNGRRHRAWRFGVT